MSKVKCGSCKGYHDSAAHVKVCYYNAKNVPSAITTKFATVKETPAVTVINTPAAVIVPAHRQVAAWKPQTTTEQAVAAAASIATGTKAAYIGSDLHKADLAKVETGVIVEEITPTQIQAQVKEEILATVLKGQDLKVDALYKMGDEVYKIIWNKSKTLKYAMRLDFASWMKKGKFVYAKNVINQLDSTMQLDLDGAKGYAKWAFEKFNVGVCCNCGKLLTNPVSVAEGIGPVCSGKIKKSWY